MSFVWSYTALETFDTCPRKFYHKFILREKEPSSPALEKGIKVHNLCEQAVKGDKPVSNPLIESVRRAKEGRKLMTEAKMGLTRDLQGCGFFGDEVWGRTAADVLILDYPRALLFDWKTGKIREKDTQLMTMAGFIFKHFPEVQVITAMNIWLEHNKPGQLFMFHRRDEAKIWQWLLPRIAEIEHYVAKKSFPEREGPLCKWCPVKACQFNRS